MLTGRQSWAGVKTTEKLSALEDDQAVSIGRKASVAGFLRLTVPARFRFRGSAQDKSQDR